MAAAGFTLFTTTVHFDAKGPFILGDPFAAGKERIMAFFHLWARAVQFPVMTGFRDGFA